MSKHDPLTEVAMTDPAITAIVIADGDGAGLVDLVDSYREVLEARGDSFNILLVHATTDAGLRDAAKTLAERPDVETHAPRPWGGLDEAGIDGIRRARGQIIVTLPGWNEIVPEDINVLLDAVAGGEADMATGLRSDRGGSRAWLTRGLLRTLFQQHLEDVFCRSRAAKREVFQHVADLGVRQHFLPLIAISGGYVVKEVPVQTAQNAVTPTLRRLKPSSHLSALVDMLSLYVVLKFLKRPLRFFGAIGLPMAVLGLLGTAWLTASRLLLGTPLADRPALVFSVMLLVLGIQIIALGLVGEIVIFASSRRMRSYEIDTILRGRPAE